MPRRSLNLSSIILTVIFLFVKLFLIVWPAMGVIKVGLSSQGNRMKKLLAL